MEDFLKNKLEIGDKIISVFGLHLRHGVIEDFIPKDFYHHYDQVKIKGIKRLFHPIDIIKL